MNVADQKIVAQIVAAEIAKAMGAPAKPAPKARASKAAAPKQARQPKAARCLVKANRKDFVEAHAWAKGLSALDIAIAVTAHKAPLAKGWAIGEGYTAKARTATPAAKRAVKAHLAA